MKVVRYRTDGHHLLVVDADRCVPDRPGFVARYCDAETGIAPPQAATADGGAGFPVSPGERSGAATADADGRGADAALFPTLEPDFRPPRVVLTVLDADGEHTPFCPRAARCAARWAADRTSADRVMLDTQAGTREARVHSDGTVGVETGDPTVAPADDRAMERDDVVREFETEVSWTP